MENRSAGDGAEEENASILEVLEYLMGLELVRLCIAARVRVAGSFAGPARVAGVDPATLRRFVAGGAFPRPRTWEGLMVLYRQEPPPALPHASLLALALIVHDFPPSVRADVRVALLSALAGEYDQYAGPVPDWLNEALRWP